MSASPVACLRCGHWLPRLLGVAAITLGRHVLVAPGVRCSAALLRHERRHVEQWLERGAAGFLGSYLLDYARGRLRGLGHHEAYLSIRLEAEAREAECGT